MPLPDDTGELENILSQAQSESGPSQDATLTHRDDAGQGETLTKTSSEGNQTLLAGKYKTAQDLEKGHLSLQKLHGQNSNRLRDMEALLENPRFHEIAAQDPEMRAALGKLGYEYQEEEAAREEEGDDWNGDERDPRFIAEVVRAENDLRWQLFEFGQARKAPLSREETDAIKTVLRTVPRLSVAQAYRLTPHFEKSAKAAEDRRFEEAMRKASPNRPRPNPTLAPGQKLDMKKPVIEMNDSERRAFITKMADENQ